MFEKEDCIKQHLFPLQVSLIHYFYHLFLLSQTFWCTKTNLFSCVKIKSYIYFYQYYKRLKCRRRRRHRCRRCRRCVCTVNSTYVAIPSI